MAVAPVARGDVIERASGVIARRACDRVDIALALVLALATLLAHPLRAVAGRPFWVDEAWVAVLTRLPWSRFASFSSSTPVGWVALIRLVPGTALQRSRFAVLGFSMATPIAAYAVVRALAWPNRRAARLAALWVALAVAFVPLSMVRNDLKQYTADAFFAVVLLGVGRMADRSHDPWAVKWLGVAALVAMPFSVTSTFVSIAVFAAVFTSALIARDATRLRAIAVVGGLVALAVVASFVALVLPHLNPALHAYWNAYYLRGSPLQMEQEAWNRMQADSTFLAMPGTVAMPLFFVGLLTLARRREYAVSLALPLLWIEMFALGALQDYPFLDRRTSHFLLVPTVAVIALGVVDLLYALARRYAVLAVVCAAVLAVSFGVGVQRWWHEFGVPPEDVRSEVRYVTAHLHPRDVVLVNAAANWGFAYYWPHGRVEVHSSSTLAAGFAATVENVNAVYASDRDLEHISLALHSALDRRRALGPSSTLYIVRSHVIPSEQLGWREALASAHVAARAVRTGTEQLLVVDPTERLAPGRS